ncbi:MAG: alpha-amylase family glycosyl hydrolase [Bacillota bacterium]|nr:alpha-amylase family glycosyl hydrolase [Bacillota bacterium]
MTKHVNFKHRIIAVFVAFACVTTCFCMNFAVNANAATTTTQQILTTSTTKAALPTASAAATPSTFSWSNATVYFLLTDRFKNGNTSNDHSYGRGQDQNGNNVSISDTEATFHGGDFAGITQVINTGYFNNLGINALWISAPYEQIHGYCVGDSSSSSFAHYAYHGYYVLDYTSTDANFGTAQEFQTMVDTAHKHGLRVVLDIVMNHAGYNTLQDMSQYGFGTLKSGWQTPYYSYQNINNTTYQSFINYTSSATDWAKWWGGDWVRAGIAGYTAPGSDDTTECLDALPDFKTESTSAVQIPQVLQTKWAQEGRLTEQTSYLNNYFSTTGQAKTVRNYEVAWLANWVRTYGVDGFRCDTAKHVDMASWTALKTACVQALKDWKAANPTKALDNLDFWMVGENWGQGLDKNTYFTQGKFDSMINFSFSGGGGMPAVGSLDSTYSSYAAAINPDPSSFNMLTYISSHDTSLCRGDMIYQGSAFLMMPGGVQVFYGDESNRPTVSAKINDHAIRGDMNWSNMNQTTLAHWQKVGTFRNSHIAVGAGQHTKLTSSSGYAFARTYSKNGLTDKIVAVISATANTATSVSVSGIFDNGTVLNNAYDGTQATVSNGSVTFNSGTNGTILIELPDGKPSISLVGATSFTTATEQVTLNLADATSALVSVNGANYKTVANGGTFTIGDTSYVGQNISVNVVATNAVGTKTGSYTFTKLDPNNLPPTPIDYAVIHVQMPAGTTTAPYLYAWTQSASGGATTYQGAWPGTQMGNLSNGWYTTTIPTLKGVFSAIINGGSGGKQSTDISGLTGEVWLKVSDSNFTTTQIQNTTSDPLASLKTAASAVKAMTASDYTADTFNALNALVPQADALIAQGSSAAQASIDSLVSQFTAKQAALVLADPMVSGFASGSTTLTGTAAPGATVTVTSSGSTTTATADLATGAWSATVPAITSSTQVSVSATRNNISSSTKTYSLTNQPTVPATSPTTNATTNPVTVPATSPVTVAPTTPTTVVRGDANLDGNCNLKDATMIQKYCAGLTTLTAQQMLGADANQDGNVSLKDATIIQKHIAGLTSW